MKAPALIMGLAALFGGGRSIDVASLPPPYSAKPVARPPGGPALDAFVTDFGAGRFKADRPRYFEVAADTSWQMVVKLLAERPPLQGKAKRVRYGSERPGLDLVEIFDAGGEHGAAIAMQGRLVGYYPIRFAKGDRRHAGGV